MIALDNEKIINSLRDLPERTTNVTEKTFADVI